jgi:hypothetical protein
MAEAMSTNGPVLIRPPERWEHAHTCYTCQQQFSCTWMYCKDQGRRNCPACLTAMRTQQEAP